MADESQSMPDDLSDQDLQLLYSNTRQQLVSSYPSLAGSSDFNSELSDAFSKFVNQGTQRGTDYNQAWGQYVAPVVAKWEARGAAAPKLAVAKGWQSIADGENPATVAKDNPLWLTDNSAKTLVRQEAMRSSKAPRLSLNANDTHSFLVKERDKAIAGSNDAQNDPNVAAAQKALNDFDTANQPSLAPVPALSPSLGSGVGAPVGAAPVPPTAPMGPGVAAPMGTSGYVTPGNASPGLTFIGKPTPQQAALLLQQWQNRTPALAASPPAGPSVGSLTPPDTDQGGGGGGVPPTVALGQALIPLGLALGGASEGSAKSAESAKSASASAAASRSSFKSAAEVKQAYKDGEIDYATAANILRNNFGVQ